MSFGDGCFEDAPRHAELEKPEYPDLRLAVWALLHRLDAIKAAACEEQGHDPLTYNCRRALNGWKPSADTADVEDEYAKVYEAGYQKGLCDGCRNPN